MEQQFPPHRGRRNYDQCNISEAELVQLDHRFNALESEVTNLKALSVGNEKMLKEIHEKIMQTKGLALGFKIGTGATIMGFAVAVSAIIAVFTGKLPLSELIKLFFP